MITVVKKGGDGQPFYYKEFMISAEADVADLPDNDTPAPDTASLGSVAYTQDMAHSYLLGPDNVWREV